MSSFLLLLVCLFLGVGFARWGRLPQQTPAALNAWIIRIALPAMVMEVLPKLQVQFEVWYAMFSPWVVFLGAWALFGWYGKRQGWPRERIGAVILSCGLGNTAFMGYPMIEALRGREALGLAVLADQLGTFMALTVGGLVMAAIYAGKDPNPKEIAKRVVAFPPFIGLIVAVVVAALGDWPAVVSEVLERIGSTLTPLALFSVGLQFQLRLHRDMRKPLIAGLGWKLVAAPVIVWALGMALGIRGLPLSVSTLQAAMAPMISAAILAEQFRLEPRLANSIVGIGILISLITVPATHLLL